MLPVGDCECHAVASRFYFFAGDFQACRLHASGQEPFDGVLYAGVRRLSPLLLFLGSRDRITKESQMTSDAAGRIEIRELGAEGIELIREIDRSEHIDLQYAFKNGRLLSEAVDFEVPSWDTEGHGEHSSARRISEFRPIVDSGATLLGAFVDGLFAGIAIVDPSFDGDTAWFAFLHVSRAYRRMGIASALWTTGTEIATAAGATSMYVSATPSGSAVGFYTSRGCRPATPHPALFAKEPEDIHLICPVTYQL